MWGDNQFGQLGDDSTASKNYPVELVGNDERWMWLDVGYAHAGAVKIDGSAWIWGLNDAGQLGSQNRINQSSPIQALLAGKTWMSVYCGRRFSGAIELPASPTPQYTPYATQTPTSTVAPTATPISTNPTPTPTASLSPTPGATQPTATPVATATPLPTGTEATVTPTPSASISPTPTGTEATATPTPSPSISPTVTPTPSASTTGSYVYAVGYNQTGQLAQNNLINTSKFVQVIGANGNWISIDAGSNSVAAIDNSFKLWVWGDNQAGELGNSNIIAYSSPISIGTNSWAQVAAGKNNIAGIVYSNITPTPSGTEPTSTPTITPTLTTTVTPTPTEIPPTATITPSPTLSPTLTASPTPSPSESATPTSSPSPSGTDPSPTPTPSYSQSPTPSGTQATATPTPSATPETGSYLYLFGNNDDGQLGQQNIISSSVPVQVVGNTNNWLQTKAGSNFTAVVKNDGSLWIWGANQDGQIGDNSVVSASSPIFITGNASSWIQVAAGKYNIVAILKK
jgi:hypothetical protein